MILVSCIKRLTIKKTSSRFLAICWKWFQIIWLNRVKNATGHHGSIHRMVAQCRWSKLDRRRSLEQIVQAKRSHQSAFHDFKGSKATSSDMTDGTSINLSIDLTQESGTGHRKIKVTNTRVTFDLYALYEFFSPLNLCYTQKTYYANYIIRSRTMETGPGR